MSKKTDLIKQAEAVLYAGLQEATGAYKEELRPFVEEYGPIIADTAIRAGAGDKDAEESLKLLKQMALSHEFIARRAAAMSSEDNIKLVVGTAIKFVVGLLS